MEVREVQLRRLPTSQGLLVDGQLVTQAPLNDPSGPVVLFERVNEAEAHPALPALFYRYYHDGSQGTNSSDGFISGLFTGSRAGFPPPPATPDQMLYHYVKAHINRNHIHSPFISVCITLNWVIRQALQAQSRDETNPRICVIDASIAGRNRKAFYPGPYHREIKKYRPYENGAQLYSGTYEFLIWGNIPKEAIICDFPLSHLREHVDGIPELSSMLGFDILSQHRRSFRNVILPQLQARNVQVKPSIIPAMASLATFLGIDATSPAAYISKVVADIIEGWGIRPSIDSWAAWYDKAKLFAIYLSTISMSGPFDQKETAEAFLAGARAGLGQYDWFRFPSKERTVNTRASRVGLGAVVGGIKPREFYQVLVDHGADLKASRQRDMVRSFRYRGES
ncbi:hypothetical protein H2203_003468 [Taxawa tesnikishii (nom. ined.)]|nr:hypothetical protein H2203_003468 [Dothideales sp. JES 119]